MGPSLPYSRLLYSRVRSRATRIPEKKTEIELRILLRIPDPDPGLNLELMQKMSGQKLEFRITASILGNLCEKYIANNFQGLTGKNLSVIPACLKAGKIPVFGITLQH